MTNYHTIFGRFPLKQSGALFILGAVTVHSIQGWQNGLPYDTAFHGQKMALRSGQSGH